MASTEQTECLIWMIEGTSLTPGTILVHTLAGAIARTKWTWDWECGKRVTWDPASEYIHTIRNGAVGGEKALVHVHALN